MDRQRAITQTGDNLTEKLHETVYEEIDPSATQLQPHFVACVIGASRGIGAAVATAFASAKASAIVIAARSTDQLQDVASDIERISPSIKVLSVACDVTSADSISNLAARIDSELGRLDAVIYNSGFSGPVILRVTEGDPADVERAFAINSVGTYLAAHYLIPLLLKSSNGAKLFFTVSTAASWITEGHIANMGYCVSKMAQMRIIEFVSLQYGQEELFAVGIHPGAVATEMAKGAPESFKQCKSWIFPNSRACLMRWILQT